MTFLGFAVGSLFSDKLLVARYKVRCILRKTGPFNEFFHRWTSPVT